MSTTDLEKFSGRPFSFYPAILNVEHNEWFYQEATWSEIRIRNEKADLEVWIPRRYVGKISEVDKPVMIVGLTHDLEYKSGMLVPYRSRLVEMPSMPGSVTGESGHRPSPPPPPSRSESATERKLGLFIVGALVAAIVVTAATVFVTRGRQSGGRIDYQAVLQADLGLTAQDDYFAVVRKLGKPSEERWREKAGERQYEALAYPDRKLTIILMGAERDKMFYLGAKNENWKNVHSVKLPGGGNTDSILRALEPF